jgi:methylase of polypeptide subunit release factors
MNESAVCPPQIRWTQDGAERIALWRSEAGLAPPRRVAVADDTMTADAAYRLACEGTALLWQGDFQNARQLLQAMARRCDQKPRRKGRDGGTSAARSSAGNFHLHRMAQAQRARILGMLLVPLAADFTVPLRRAPDVREACAEAFDAEACGPSGGPALSGTPGHAGGKGDDMVLTLRELQALVGAHEWRKKGVPVPALGGTIHPYYGVFSPLRGEYIDLVAAAPLPAALTRESLAFDIGTGTGVLAALLARRGVRRVVGTDRDARALACARDNLRRLGLGAQVGVVEADLFPEGRAPLVVCNPPWVPAKPSSPIEAAVFDPDSRMLRGFLAGLAAHLSDGGEGWLILSDLAEHLGLRSRADLEGWIAQAGLRVVGRDDIRPRHGKAADPGDPLHAARAAELTSLWRLGRA